MTVIVVGNAAVDTTFEVARLPAIGESILASAVREDLGGKGLNQAVAAARAGADVVFHAAVGSDAAADRVEALLLAEGMATDGLRRAAGSTDRTSVFVTPDGQNAIVTAAHQAGSLPSDVAAAAVSVAAAGDHVLLQGNLSLDATRACARAARDRGATVVVNPSPIAFDYTDLWGQIDVVVANEGECQALGNAEAVVEAARTLGRAGTGVVVVTRGTRDTLVVQGTGEFTVPVQPVTAVDTTGAGDAFCGTLVASLAAGLGLATAVENGAAVAAKAVMRPGAIASFPPRDGAVP